MKIVAIETSCDETAIAIAEFSPHLLSTNKQQRATPQPTKGAGFLGPQTKLRIRVLSNIVSSQVKLHARFGGVVPNLAKREHQKNLVPILLKALKEAGLLEKKKSDFPRAFARRSGFGPRRREVGLRKMEKILERERDLFARIVEYVVPLQTPKIDALAVTHGPGLAPALWVGVNFARALAYLWKKPLIPINHMAGHAYSALLQKANSKWQIANIKFPALALLVSGGHTELVFMRGHGKYKILGETLDDAAGEAFDKVARLLDLGYPGGPEISRLAKSGNPGKYPLPSPMINTKDYNFSFSGLKTAVLYLLRDEPRAYKRNVAASFQKAVVDVLVKKTIRAAQEYKVKTVLLGGGVAANNLLRKNLKAFVKNELSNIRCLTVEPELAGDNALMIALAAQFRWASLAQKGRAAYFSGKKKAPMSIGADANIKLS